jgi:predicted deacylase
VIVICGLFVAVIWYVNNNEVSVQTIEKPTFPIRKIIGYSVDGRAIESYTYGDGAKKVLFVGGVHGGYEWNSVLLAYNFIDYLDINPNIIPSELNITIIPVLNPDGLYKVTNKEGRFEVTDVSTDKSVLASGRFNSNEVDLNRNFDCKWQSKSMWQSKTVSAGTNAFSEPEALVLKNFILENKIEVAIFWHSQANAVYASECHDGVLTKTTDSMNVYAKASGYNPVETFDAYAVTGDAEGWLASMGIPAITVELKTRDSIEWDRNLAGIKALLEYWSNIHTVDNL